MNRPDVSRSRSSGLERLNVAILPAWYPTTEQPMSGVFVREHARAAALHHRVAAVANGGVRRDGPAS